MLCLCLALFSTACDDDDKKTTDADQAGEVGGTPEGGTPEGGTPEGGSPEGGTPEGGTPEGGEEPEGPGNIAEVALANGNFTTLVAAVEAAGLTDVLTGEGPLTVLAPTDAAFEALPAGTVDSLLTDAAEGGDALAKILSIHVVSGAAVESSALSDGDTVTTLNGDLTVSIDGDVVTFSSPEGSANVAIADVPASNGVIHAIDAVLMPQKNIIETAVAAGNFTSLVAAVEAADLTDTLNGEGPFTVFAPTDAAFDALPAGTVEGLLMGAANGETALASILQTHVVSGAFPSTELSDGQVVPTLNGDVTVNISGEGAVTITYGDVVANVSTANIETANGVIHVIDAVLVGE